MCPRILVFLMIMLAATACVNNQPAPPAPIINGWKQNAAESSSYRVQSDDSIYSIAWTYGMDYRDIARYNNLTEPYAIHEGQILRMSPRAAPAAMQSVAVATPVPVAPSFTRNAAQTEASPETAKPAVTVTPVATPPAPALVLAPSPSPAPAAPAVASVHAATTTIVTSWIWPTKGSVVKGFSAASGNRGIDISGKIGQPVVASAGGKVVYAGSGLKGYGNLIIIKHNDNELSAYAFNKSLAVKEGDYVKRGQQIATMGKNDDGKPVLHFEIRRDGKPVNPMTYLQ